MLLKPALMTLTDLLMWVEILCCDGTVGQGEVISAPASVHHQGAL